MNNNAHRENDVSVKASRKKSVEATRPAWEGETRRVHWGGPPQKPNKKKMKCERKPAGEFGCGILILNH